MSDDKGIAGVSLCEVRSVCGGDYALAGQVCDLLDRESKWARKNERTVIAKEIKELSSVKRAKGLVTETGFDSEDAGNCVLAESIISLVAVIVEKGAEK